MKILYNCTIVTMDKDFQIIKGKALLVLNNIITEIDKAEILFEKFGKLAKKFDLNGKIIMPGLINCHTHLPMSLLRGFADDMELGKWLTEKIFPTEAKLMQNSENIILGTQLSLAEMIKSGTTCVNDMYYHNKLIAQTCEKVGMRALMAESFIDFPTPCCSNVDEIEKYSEELINDFLDSELIKPGISAHSPYTCSRETLIRSKKLAEKYGVHFQIHLSETKTEYDNCIKEHGLSPVKYLESINVLNQRTIAAHCVHLSSEDIEILKTHKVKIAHNPNSNLKLTSGIAPLPLLLEKEISVALATDGSASNNSQNMFSDIKTCALIHKINNQDPKVLPARQVVELATIRAAEVLGLKDKIGSIEVGKLADFITIDSSLIQIQPIYNIYSSIVYSMNGSEIVDVMINGDFVMKDRKLLTLDEDYIRSKVNEVCNL